MENLRKRIMDGSSLLPGAMANGSNAVVTDILFSSNDGEQLCIIHGQENWPDAGWTPIGIVVVPGTHNRYGDGSCGIMSLAGMSPYNPEMGVSENYSICWGEYTSTVGNGIFLSTKALDESVNFIPYQVDKYSTACTIYSGNIVWPYAGTTTAPTSGASTAYTNTDGYVTAMGGKAGCDFNGIRNTVACYVATRTSVQWTASSIENTLVTPAAACCGRFKTVGTKSLLDVYSGTTSNNSSYGTPTSTKDNKGFWYLPAAGELCYLPSKRFEIIMTIRALNQKYGNVGDELARDYSYWSSSEYSTEAWTVSLKSGDIERNSKDTWRCVRAFMRL